MSQARHSNQQHQPLVHYSNGAFLIFKADYAKQLRRRRIMSQTVAAGAPPTPQSAGPPYCISPYAAYVVASLNLAQFVHLQEKRDISLLDNQNKFATRLLQLADHEKELHMTKRMAELRRHNLPPTEKNLGEFDESKLRLAISETPSGQLASYEEYSLSGTQIQSLVVSEHLRTSEDRKKLRIYHDLYERGFYISSGMKFGSDFLAYMGDPVRYHAQYAIRLVASADSATAGGADADTQAGVIDLSETDFSEMNCLQRLTHTANKIPLFATVDNSPLPRVRYWTLKERVYLNPNSCSSDLERIEPRVDLASIEQIKVRRTS